ncbi:mitotic-spindle organizing protein 2 isoform X2 [Halichoeres trimaculatus]|uniref:mitotic-spindle organizing protein 2 isoform X2 n=1 Tax=Halichoeres trimaculatus TaxID=147232 RepID=UPI003D9DCE07
MMTLLGAPRLIQPRGSVVVSSTLSDAANVDFIEVNEMSQQPPQTVPSAPDSPALVVTSNVQKYAIKKKKVLSAEELELFELTQAAGITVDQEVFKIIVDLLKMNVAPQAVFQTLKAMCAGQRVAEGCGATESSNASLTTSITTAPTETRVRSKAGASHSEKSREASSQRVQRQPSATRGQKTKSSGSSSSSSQINST